MTSKTLADEINLDPLGRGYSGMTDSQAASSFNVADRIINKTSLSNTQILEAIDPAALLALTGEQSVRVWGILGMDSVDPFGNAANIFIDAFGAGTQTILDLQALRVKTITRAEELGLGYVSEQMVTVAINGGF